MARIEKATKDMFEDVCELFVDELPPEKRAGTVDKFYRPIFDYKWQREEDYCGHVLVDKGKIVGFVGAFFVQRSIKGKLERFANLTTWKVREENRSESIFLMMHYLRQKEITVTGRTAGKEIAAIHEKLGFRNLDSTIRIVPNFIGALQRTNGIALGVDSGDLENRLKDVDLQIYRDHQAYKCRHLLLHGNGRYCYLVYSPVQKRHVRMAHLHYISDLTVFLENLPLVKSRLLLHDRIPFLWIEERFLRGRKVPVSYGYNSRYTHLYKSDRLAREDIDNLYTELIVFNTLENRFY